jgi:hypothetical protein
MLPPLHFFIKKKKAEQDKVRFCHQTRQIYAYLPIKVCNSSIFFSLLFFLLLAKLKPYDHVGPKGTVEHTINRLHKREKSKHKQSREKIRNNMHVLCGHSTKH